MELVTNAEYTDAPPPSDRARPGCERGDGRCRKWSYLFWSLPSLILAGSSVGCSRGAQPQSVDDEGPRAVARDGLELATFAGGCFWCVESAFERLPGVDAVVSGYTGGPEANPTYEQVAGGRTGHVEAIQISFDPDRISYEDLLLVFWRNVDPTDSGGQFVDRGSQYETAIFVHSAEQRRAAEASKEELASSGRFDRPIVTPIRSAGHFFPAEAYHQDFFITNPTRYHSYRAGSGRDRYLDRVWGDEPHGRDAGQGLCTTSYERPGDEELRERLTDRQYSVTRQDGTEPPFNNEYWNNHRDGIYVDVVTGEPLFSSQDKFDSGSGWPSFTRPLVSENVVERQDGTMGMVRTEVRSRHGDSHLGHLFPDGPGPSGLRYCINSASLRFVPAEDLARGCYGEFAEAFESDAER